MGIDLFPGQTGNRLNFRGDVVDAVMTQRRPFGPDLHGAKYSAVGAQYDRAADLTRVQLRPIPTPQRGAGQPMGGELPPMTRQQRRQFERQARKAENNRRTR